MQIPSLPLSTIGQGCSSLSKGNFIDRHAPHLMAGR
jgi:hypothetical protein